MRTTTDGVTTTYHPEPNESAIFRHDDRPFGQQVDASLEEARQGPASQKRPAFWKKVAKKIGFSLTGAEKTEGKKFERELAESLEAVQKTSKKASQDFTAMTGIQMDNYFEITQQKKRDIEAQVRQKANKWAEPIAERFARALEDEADRI